MKIKNLISIILISETFANAAYVAPKDPITLMKDWTSNFRTLDCW